jgi:NAD(P)-dependent dehydrogenase (short-subunit alcohol dehydrogenase family)
MGLTRTHAKEFGEWGIRVNNVIPVEEQVREVLTEEYRREMVGAQSLKRDSMPEVANVIFVFGK